MEDIANMVTVGIIEMDAARLKEQYTQETDPLKKEALRKKYEEYKKIALLMAIYKV